MRSIRKSFCLTPQVSKRSFWVSANFKILPQSRGSPTPYEADELRSGPRGAKYQVGHRKIIRLYRNARR